MLRVGINHGVTQKKCDESAVRMFVLRLQQAMPLRLRSTALLRAASGRFRSSHESIPRTTGVVKTSERLARWAVTMFLGERSPGPPLRCGPGYGNAWPAGPESQRGVEWMPGPTPFGADG